MPRLIQPLRNAAPAWRSWVRGVFIAVVVVAALTFAPTSGPATAGLVAAFAFDEGSGSTVTDLSGTGNTGTISNATWTTAGKYGKALIFNGTNARVNVPDAASLHLTSAMTLEAWVNPSVVTRAWRDVIYKGDDNYYLEGTSTRNSAVPVAGGTFGSATTEVNGPSALTPNTWTHLAVTYGGGALKLYANGAQVASRSRTGNLATSTNQLQIGGDSIYGQYFSGTIDEIRIYNATLSAAQIQTDMTTPVSGSPADTQAPTTPTNLTATAAGSAQINLSWTASSDNVGVTGYRVERCQGAGCSNFAEIATPAGTSFSDSGRSASTSYSYRVRATDAAGNLSGYSNTSSATTQAASDTQAPTAPTNLTATAAGSAQINLSWTASSDNVGVTGYRVERCQGAGCSNFAEIATPAGTSFSDSGRSASTSYSYRVRATDAAGNLSGYSNTSSATTQAASDTQAPTAPTNLTATAAGSAQINLSWTASSDNVGVTGYRVERCQGAGCSNFAEIATPAGTSFSDSGRSASTSYSYRVRATDAAGNLSGYSNTSSATTQSTSSGLAAAYAFDEGTGTTAADASGNGLTGTLTNGATWGAGKYGNALQLDGSNDFVNLGNPTALQLTGSMTVSAWVNSAAFPADDAAIVSKRASGETGFQLDTTIDRGPRTISFKLTNGSGGQMFRYGATTLQASTWYHVAGVYDAASSALHVYLNGQLDDGALVGTVTSSQQNSTANVNIGQRPTGGFQTNGRIDDVRVYNATLSAAQIQTDMTTPVSGSPADTQAPTAPTNLTATAAGSAQINLSWTASSDNVGVTGYRVERCQGAGCSNFAEIATPAGTSFSDSGRSASTSYSYRVRATDAAGNLSGYSNTSSATTQAASDTQAPTAPTNLTATAAGSAQINLSWTASSDNVGVTGYRVERCQGAGCSNFAEIATPAGTSFSDSGRSASTSYSYRVRATDAAGNLSGYSNTSSATTQSTPSTYSIGGMVSGLSGTVVLQNNGGSDLSVASNGPFTFSTPLADGTNYNVTVKTSPSGQSCTVSSASGTIASANVTNVAVACSDNPTTPGSDDFNRADGGLGPNWTNISDGGLSISSQAVAGSSGGYAGDIRTSETYASDQYSQVEVTSTQLTGGQWIGPAVRAQNGGTNTYLGIYFWNNGSPILSLYKRSAGNWIQLGSSYNSGPLAAGTKLKLIAVGSRISFLQDGVERIAVSDSSVTGGAPGIISYGAAKADNWSGGTATSSGTYLIGGTISGLSGTVVLQNNGGDDLSVSSNGTFTFSTPLADGSAYQVTVQTSPSGQTCTASNASGTVTSANVTNVTVACSTTPSGFQVIYRSTDANGVVSYDVTSANNGYGTQVLRVLAPNDPTPGVPHNFLYVLPVEAGLGTQYGDGLETMRALDAQDQYNLTIIEPSFGIEPWYADNPNDSNLHYETFMTDDLLPWVTQNLALTGHEQNWLIGFSKSGIGGEDLILRHPDLFTLAASWDFPADMSAYDQFGSSSANSYGTDSNFQANYRLTSAFLDAHKAPFLSDNRIWIGGYSNSAPFQDDMSDYDALLTSEGIAHTTETPQPMLHRWDSGWVPIALAALRQDSSNLSAT